MSDTQTASPVSSIPRFWRIQDWRIGTKLLVSLLLIALVPFAVVAIASVRASRNALLAQGTTQLLAASKATSTSIDQYLSGHRDDIIAESTLLSFVTFVQTPTSATARADALKELKALANKRYVESLAIVNSDGVILVSSSDGDINANVATSDWFAEAIKPYAGFISDPEVSTVTNQPAMFFSSPIIATSGRTVGVLSSRVSLQGLWDLVEKDLDVAGVGTFGELLDEDGIRIAHSGTVRDRQAIIDTTLYRAIAAIAAPKPRGMVTVRTIGSAVEGRIIVQPLPEVADAIKNGTSTFESTADNSSVRHYAAIAPLKVKPWNYVLMTPLPTFTGPADNLGMMFALMALAVALIVVIAAFFMARGFTRPIVHLIQAADRISLGELDVNIEISRRDEIGELAEAISRMQLSLQTAMERLRARRAAK